MLCSDCKKNTAVIFVNIQDKDGKMKTEGYCYDCAKKRGINPLNAFSNTSNLSESDLNNMTEQLNSMFKDLSGNLAIQGISEEDLNKMAEEMANREDSDENADGPKGFAVPLGSIFSGMFGGNGSNNNNNNSQTRQAVKEDKKANKKLKTLYTYGTNLTNKARNNEIDRVIGREKEIARVIQILNRRTKNNPCLIGEPGVGKTAIAQGLAIRIAEGNVPAKLLNKEVFLLDMTAIVAGTQF